jgi:hypothetical protein
MIKTQFSPKGGHQHVGSKSVQVIVQSPIDGSRQANSDQPLLTGVEGLGEFTQVAQLQKLMCDHVQSTDQVGLISRSQTVQKLGSGTEVNQKLSEEGLMNKVSSCDVQGELADQYVHAGYGQCSPDRRPYQGNSRSAQVILQPSTKSPMHVAGDQCLSIGLEEMGEFAQAEHLQKLVSDHALTLDQVKVGWDVQKIQKLEGDSDDKRVVAI